MRLRGPHERRAGPQREPEAPAAAVRRHEGVSWHPQARPRGHRLEGSLRGVQRPVPGCRKRIHGLRDLQRARQPLRLGQDCGASQPLGAAALQAGRVDVGRRLGRSVASRRRALGRLHHGSRRLDQIHGYLVGRPQVVAPGPFVGDGHGTLLENDGGGSWRPRAVECGMVQTYACRLRPSQHRLCRCGGHHRRALANLLRPPQRSRRATGCRLHSRRQGPSRLR
mmetsp:Transcript_33839/g.90009  ORF Transcript_33839/g.90009 Transcript_33839/m.90009 type:complete len:224 (+) Transcript_33839:321-992(+)